MRFTDAFGISPTDDDDWFDPVLSVDVGLFIDPFLIYWEDEGVFEGAHDEIIGFFDYIFKLVAASGGSRHAREWRKAVSLLCLKEPSEFCLGYTGGGTDGSGTGPKLAERTVRAIWKAIDVGLHGLEHFEEIQLFEMGIGPDRISDDTARILLWRFIEYTAAVAVKHDLPTKVKTYPQARFDIARGRWAPVTARLPINPRTGTPVLLTPSRFLRELPTVNTRDFLEYCFDKYPDVIASHFGEDLMENVSKVEIIAIALRNPGIVEKYQGAVRGRDPVPYALDKDPHGLVSWHDAGRAAAQRNPISLKPATPAEFQKFILECVKAFRHFVEQQGGWRLLWNDNKTPRRERTAQDALLGVLLGYCDAAGVKIAREADVGRGPVDFMLTQGTEVSAHIELKLGKNAQGLHGIIEQLPTYMKADRVDFGVFLVVAHTEADLERAFKWEKAAKKQLKGSSLDIRFELIDAQRDKPSASKI